MNIHVEHSYLHIPIKNGAEKKVLTFVEGSHIERYLEVELAVSDDADWIAAYSMKGLLGRNLELRIDGMPVEGEMADLFKQVDERWQPDDLYAEERRPGFHFSPRTGWQNDPNGLVRVDGVWHMFYQHNPVGIQWGNMHWGHAVSADLVHWDERDDELFPDALGTMFSGCAMSDDRNVSGFGDGSRPPILLYYTAAGHHAPERSPFTQCLAFSTDNGLTFLKYESNPVIPSFTDANRDPKVIYHGESRTWIMSLYLERRGDVQVFALLRSSDLISWQRFQDIGLPGSGECPDFFPLLVDGAAGSERWVFMAADGTYLIGLFNGEMFTTEEGPFEGITGGRSQGAAYASQTFAGAPDGRIIQISWIRGDVHDQRFNMSMSIPMDLTLRLFPDGTRLCAEPVPELSQCYTSDHSWTDIDCRNGWTTEVDLGQCLDIGLTVDPAGSGMLVMEVYGLETVIDLDARTISYGDQSVTIHEHPRATVRVLVDRCSFELFADRGRCRMAFRAFPDFAQMPVALKGGAHVSELSVREVG